MLYFIRKLFTTDLYIKVSKNKLEAKNLSFDEGWQTVHATEPFTTERLLVGTFSAAEPLFTQLITNVTPRSFIRQSLRAVIQPMELIEGGLSEVEEKILKELALGAGAFKVVLHTGAELTTDEARKLVTNA